MSHNYSMKPAPAGLPFSPPLKLHPKASYLVKAPWPVCPPIPSALSIFLVLHVDQPHNTCVARQGCLVGRVVGVGRGGGEGGRDSGGGLSRLGVGGEVGKGPASSWQPASLVLVLNGSSTRGGSSPLQVLRQYSINLSEEEFFHILEYYDKTLSSKISYNDFLRAFLQ